MELAVPIPLDPDGFLRRECPSCHRAFKWLPRENSEPTHDGLYGCPYCRSREEDFMTAAQIEYLTWVAGQEAMREIEQHGFKVESDPPPPLPIDSGDMERIDLRCHPDEPVKVYEEWIDTQAVYCIVCGEEHE